MTNSSFQLKSSPFSGDIPLGLYELPRRSGEAHLYRLNHSLAEAILFQAKSRALAPAELVFDLSGHDGKVSVLEPLQGRAGILSLHLFTVESLNQAEDYLIFAGTTDDGQILENDILHRFFTLSVKEENPLSSPPNMSTIDQQITERTTAIQKSISMRNALFFEAEADKLDSWSDDLKLGLERDIKDLDRQIKEAKRAASAALSLEEKIAGQKQIKAIESQRNSRRRELFDAQDEIDRKREILITDIEDKLKQKIEDYLLFTIRWSIV